MNAEIRGLPICVPTNAMSGDSVASAGPVVDTNVPEKKPYAIQNMMIAPIECIEVQLNATIEEKRTKGAIMFRGPIRSAISTLGQHSLSMSKGWEIGSGREHQEQIL